MTERGPVTQADLARAATWQAAIDANADMFTMLSPKQRQMVRDRIEWATAEDLIQRRSNP